MVSPGAILKYKARRFVQSLGSPLGERRDRRLWRMKGAERVAAVEILRSESRAKNFGHRNRESWQPEGLTERVRQSMPLRKRRT